jgi:glutaminase
VEWCENRLLAGAHIELTTDLPSQDLCEQYLCTGMTPQELASLEQAGEQREFAQGTRIVRAGDTAESLYFILSGQVDVLVDTDGGQQLRLTTLASGTVFGEVALVNQQRRTADVVAASDAVCLEVRFDDLQDAVRTRMLVNMASYFASKIQRDTELVQHLG